MVAGTVVEDNGTGQNNNNKVGTSSSSSTPSTASRRRRLITPHHQHDAHQSFFETTEFEFGRHTSSLTWSSSTSTVNRLLEEVMDVEE
jgi:hypothetical protein